MSGLLSTAAVDERNAYLSMVDPRARLLAAVASSLVLVVAGRLGVVGLGLLAAAAAWTVSGVPLPVVAKRLLPLNILMLLLAALLPMTTPGTTFWRLGALQFSHEGLQLAAMVAMKGNAVVLTLVVLLGTMDAVTLGHALRHLRVPEKLIHLMLFTVRYLDVLHREYLRLRAAMKMRGFRPGLDRHTFRTFGYLVGMLLVRSLDRAERIVAAMKCRGFRGHFFMLDHFAFSRRDVPFCLAWSALLLLLVLAEGGLLQGAT
jgi:cobalt/nickel transport system permease protein